MIPLFAFDSLDVEVKSYPPDYAVIVSNIYDCHMSRTYNLHETSDHYVAAQCCLRVYQMEFWHWQRLGKTTHKGVIVDRELYLND